MKHKLISDYQNKSCSYDLYRPLYPREAILFMINNLDLSSNLPVIDVGAGTGILTRQLAGMDLNMIGIEPDSQMLNKAKSHDGKLTINYFSGTSENLGIESKSVAAIVCGQAFHWFEPQSTLVEFKRVLATDNPVFLIWNNRVPDYDEFHIAYNETLHSCFESYADVSIIDDELTEMLNVFFTGTFKEINFANNQRLNLSGFINRTMSCSYACQPGSPEYLSASNSLKLLYDEFQNDGYVYLNYNTHLVYGRI